MRDIRMGPRKKTENSISVYQIKVTLKGIKPPIWRRIEVTSDITLHKLHRILQVVMGWDDYHLHQFTIGWEHYGVPDPDYSPEFMDDKKTRLHQVVHTEKTKFLYEYDFGDSWEHEILVEKILPVEEGKCYPVCVKGKRACPPEDVGGIWGYAEFLDAIEDPEHTEHKKMLEWAGGSFDSEAFDLDAVNQALKKTR